MIKRLKRERKLKKYLGKRRDVRFGFERFDNVRLSVALVVRLLDAY